LIAGAASLGISREASGLERPHIPGLAVPAKDFEMEKASRFEPFSLQQFALEHKFKTVVEI
jgi:hypothetical protein